MDYKMFTNSRVLFVLQRCVHCRVWMEFIERINLKLPIEKRIKIVDCTYYQNYGILTDPLISLYGKHFDGFPTLFIGSLKIVGMNSRIEAETYLNALLEEEYVNPEQDNRKFLKECERIKKGWFGEKIICKN
ncbi:MAG: hypothetical protein AABY22_23395 [Nanoarchaeota archaeon]